MLSGSPRAVVRHSLILLFTATISAWAQQPIGSLKATDTTVHGAVVLATNGAAVMSGSQLTSGEHGADITLARGGDVRLCPHTQLNLTASASGRELLLALGAGSMEVDYELGSSADAIITPDFRIQLAGPGIFRYAFNVNEHGDVCVQSRPGSTASVIVYQLLGDGAHQVRAGDSILFRGGNVNASSKPLSSCGCPQPLEVITVRNAPKGLDFPEEQSRKAAVAMAEGDPVAPSFSVLPAPPGMVLTTVDAPMVFRGEDLPPPPVRTSSLKLPKPALPLMMAEVAPPPAPEMEKTGNKEAEPAKPKKGNWFKKLGSAIAHLFH